MTGKDGPVGILTFLIADVRGYTSFTQAHGDEAAARLAGKFAEVTREAIEAHGGELTELRGDEALCVFTSPRAALRAAADLQTVYADETAIDPSLPMRVGIGLDSGEAVAVAGGYRGGALNLAARLCSRAVAGQVLVSQGVVHLARAVEGIELELEGDFEFKGLSEPMRVFRAVADRPVMTPPANGPTELPAALQAMTPIIGGEAEVRRLRWMWRMARRGDGRVVAVIGPTGIGKTRLAAEVAAAVAGDGGVARYASFANGHKDVAHLLADGGAPGAHRARPDGLRRAWRPDRAVSGSPRCAGHRDAGGTVARRRSGHTRAAHRGSAVGRWRRRDRAAAPARHRSDAPARRAVCGGGRGVGARAAAHRHPRRATQGP